MADTQLLVKMEDIHTSSASPAPSEPNFSTTAGPDAIVVHSKPAKKRKSWGQELPVPKTTLPPRKRAKTDDEKEQRRIERIKRNRAAAHNSRERKRQETENLAVKLARANAEIAAFKQCFGPLPSHIVLPEVRVEVDGEGNETVRTYNTHDSPAPSLTESHGSQPSSSPRSIEDDHTFHDIGIKTEPDERAVFVDVPVYDNVTKSEFAPLEPTQRLARTLWRDLQCRSSSANSNRLAKVYMTFSTQPTLLMTTNLHLSTIMTSTPSQPVDMIQVSAISSLNSTTSSTLMRNSSKRSTLSRLAHFCDGQSAPLLQTLIDVDEIRRWRGRSATLRDHDRQEAFEKLVLDGDLANGDLGDGRTGVRNGRLLGWVATVSPHAIIEYNLCSFEKLHTSTPQHNFSTSCCGSTLVEE